MEVKENRIEIYITLKQGVSLNGEIEKNPSGRVTTCTYFVNIVETPRDVSYFVARFLFILILNNETNFLSNKYHTAKVRYQISITKICLKNLRTNADIYLE